MKHKSIKHTITPRGYVSNPTWADYLNWYKTLFCMKPRPIHPTPAKLFLPVRFDFTQLERYDEQFSLPAKFCLVPPPPKPKGMVRFYGFSQFKFQ